MNATASTLPRLLDQLSITLLHSLWIGALVALLLAALLTTLLRRRSPAARGRVAEGALLVFSLAVIGVF